MSNLTTILVGENPSDDPPNSEMKDIWPRVTAVLRHYALLNRDEARVRELQHGILAKGALIVPSIYRDGGDLCKSSIFHNDLIFYRFCEGEEEYFWITSQLDRCYSLSVLYLPRYKTALALYPYTAEAPTLQSFEELRSRIEWPVFPSSARPRKPTVVSGYHHMMHHLWNQLPALDRAIGAGLAQDLNVIAAHQPMGPLDEIFPELTGKVTIVQSSNITSLLKDTEFFVALGAWSIPETTQRRLIQVARQHSKQSTKNEQLAFRNAHWPIFWLSVKPPMRTCDNQVDVLVNIMTALKNHFPDAGFILNGVSYPWDYETNENYLSWFRDMLVAASAATSEIISVIFDQLSDDLANRTRTVHNVSVLEEITWQDITDFYICHGGSMQNKIGWIRPTPGVTHSNTSFMTSGRRQIPPVERADAAYCFVPDEIVIDDDQSNYSPMQIARKDQNYHFVSDDALLNFVLKTFNNRHLMRGARVASIEQLWENLSENIIVEPRALASSASYKNVATNGKIKSGKELYSISFTGEGNLRHSGIYYTDFMKLIDQQLQPDSYFEIGTDTGNSLNSFSCDAVCVDPDFKVTENVWKNRRRTLLYQCTSDNFFARETLNKILLGGPDIAFLDGMHKAEYLLRDFMNTESMSHRRTLILMHDCLPLNVRMAERVPRRGDDSEGIYRDAWTGDVCRVLFVIKKFRPDLKVQYLNCPPTGLVAISNLNPVSTILQENYEACAELMQSIELSDDRLRELWGLYPIVDTTSLAENAADITGILNCH